MKIKICPDLLAEQEKRRKQRLAILINPKKFTLEYIKKKQDEYRNQ